MLIREIIEQESAQHDQRQPRKDDVSDTPVCFPGSDHEAKISVFLKRVRSAAGVSFP